MKRRVFASQDAVDALNKFVDTFYDDIADRLVDDIAYHCGKFYNAQAELQNLSSKIRDNVAAVDCTILVTDVDEDEVVDEIHVFVRCFEKSSSISTDSRSVPGYDSNDGCNHVYVDCDTYVGKDFYRVLKSYIFKGIDQNYK